MFLPFLLVILYLRFSLYKYANLRTFQHIAEFKEILSPITPQLTASADVCGPPTIRGKNVKLQLYQLFIIGLDYILNQINLNNLLKQLTLYPIYMVFKGLFIALPYERNAQIWKGLNYLIFLRIISKDITFCPRSRLKFIFPADFPL